MDQPREMPRVPRREQRGKGRARDQQLKLWLAREHLALLDTLATRWRVTRTVVLERLLERAVAAETQERGNDEHREPAGGHAGEGG